MSAPARPVIPLRVLRQVALDAGVHEQTARRVAAGRPCRQAGRERVLEAMAKHGIDTSLLPEQSDEDESDG